MRTVSFSGKVEEYQGKALESVIPYSGDVEVFENLAEAKQSERWPGDSEILKFVNTRLVTAAKAARYQEVTKPLKEAWESSAEFKRKSLVDSIMLGKNCSRADAESLADTILGA